VLGGQIVKPDGRIDEILDQALRRLGKPSREDLEGARERIRKNLRNTNPADLTSLSCPDTRPVSLWGVRQPFVIAGGVVVALAALVMTTLWIPSRSSSESVSIPVERPRAGAAPPASQTDSGQTSRETQSKEMPRSAGIDLPASRPKVIQRPAAKPPVEKGKLPELPPAVTDARTTGPEAIPPPESVLVQPDGDPGRAVLNQVCTVCHSLRGIEKHNYSSPEAYRDLVSDMISRGAVISDEEMMTIVDYLYRTYGQK
jgi:hypothetical protein